jgi:hypothetical protein
MDDKKQDLIGLDGSPVGVYVSGQFFKMGQLSQADYVNCHEWKIAQAVEVIIAAAPQNFRPDTADIKAMAIAKIVESPVDPIRLLTDAKCIERLAFSAVQRAGPYPGNWGGFVANLDKRGYQELQAAVWKCSGFTVPEKKKDDAEDANANANP